MSGNSTLDNSDSEEDSQVIKSTTKTKTSFATSESELSDGEHDTNNTSQTPHDKIGRGTTPRSSERLRKKSQRRYRKPDRRETLNKIAVGEEKYEDWSLKPRRLTNDFVMGCSRYVTDRAEVFESEGSELSEFIDDSEISTCKKHQRRKPRQKRRRSGKMHVETEQTKDIKDKKTVDRKRRKQARKKIKQLSSDDEIQPEEKVISCETSRRRTRKWQDETKLVQGNSNTSSGEGSDINKSCQKLNKHHKNLVSDETKSSSSQDDDCKNMKLKKCKRQLSARKIRDLSDSEEYVEPTCKLPKRTRSGKKEKEGQLLAKLTAKRKMEKLKMEQQNSKKSLDTAQVECADIVEDIRMMKDALNTSESENEATHDDDHFAWSDIEGESDQEFVVDDDYCDADSDGVSEFFRNLHNVDNVTVNDRLKLKEKKLNSFQRICIAVESDESEDESTILDSTTLNVFNAIKENNVELVRTSLESNSSIVDELGPKRRSLLHYAVMFGCPDITKMLIDCNADPFAVDIYSLQPFNYAILTGHINCLKLLLQYSDLKETNRRCEDNLKINLLHFIVYGKTILPDNLKCEVVGDSKLVQCIRALYEQDRSLLSELMEKNDSQGFSPLVAAIAAGNCQCVEYLLFQGALVDDFESKNGGNLLHLALECLMEAEDNGSLCLKVLLGTTLKQKINEVDNSGFTPLMYAAQSGNNDCVLALLEAGASVSCKDLHGTTSLHLAAASGDTQSVELLLKYGHQVDCLDSCGWPPLLYANFAAQESCVLALMKPNPKQIFVLGDLLRRGTSQAAKERNFKVVKDVLVALANQDAYYRVFNDFIRLNPEFLDEYDHGLLHKTWKALLDYDNKLAWFKRKLISLRSSYPRYVALDVDREAVFESAMNILKHYGGISLRNCELSVTFKNEAGICTGPKREFFVNICKDIVDSRHQLFRLTDDNQYSFLPNAYFAEMAKTEVVTFKSETGTSSKMGTDQLSGMDNDGLYGTSNLSSGISVSTPVEHSPEFPTSEHCSSQSNGLQGTVAGMSGSSSAVAGISELSGEDCAEGTSSDSSTLMDNLGLSGTHCNFHGQSISRAPRPSVEYMDKKGDRIIAGLDTNVEFAKYIDRKLATNIAKLKFLGRIIGLAICEGHFLNLHLCKPLVKQILGTKLNHPEDLSSFDYELHKNLVTFVLESDDVEDLMLPCDLNVLNPWNGRCTTIKLFPPVRNEEFVNDKNKAEYVELVSQHKLAILIKEEMNALCRGLYEVIPKSLFSLFSADEFSLLINGVGKIDVDDWRKNTVYTPHDAASKHKEIKWFWEIVEELREEEKALLLKFSTGSPCLPAGGFSQLQGLGGQKKFEITMKSDLNKIPTASTCFNNLKLSSYENIKDLKDKLLIAIRHGTEGFSFS